MSVAGHLRHRALWKRCIGGNQRGDRTYFDAVEIPCRIERRSRFEEGEGTSQYTKILIPPVEEMKVEVGDMLDIGDGEFHNVDDFQDQVDMSGRIVARICYLASGSRQ